MISLPSIDLSPAVYRRTFTVGISMAVLALAVFLGRRSSDRDAFIIVGLVALFVLLRKPELGFVAQLVLSLGSPFTLGTGTGTTLNPAILIIPVLLVVWILRAWHSRTLGLARSPINAPVFAFIGSATISLVAGGQLWNYFADQASSRTQMGAWAIFVLSPILLLLVGNQIQNLRWLKILTWLFLFLGAFAVLSRAWPAFGTVARWVILDQVASGSLFWLWLICLAGGQAIFNSSLAWPWRLLLAAFAAVTLAVNWFFARYWVSGWLPGSVVIWLLIFFRSKRLGILVGLLAAVYILGPGAGIVSALDETKQYSQITRWLAWQIITQLTLSTNPLVGLGPANYYYYTPLYPILGYYVSFNSHNQYVDLLAQLGIVGLLVFLWLMFAVGRTAWRIRDTLPDGFARGYLYGCLAGLGGTLAAGMLADWFLPFVYNIGINGFRASMLGWFFLGGIISIGQIAIRSSNPPQKGVHQSG